MRHVEHEWRARTRSRLAKRFGICHDGSHYSHNRSHDELTADAAPDNTTAIFFTALQRPHTYARPAALYRQRSVRLIGRMPGELRSIRNRTTLMVAGSLALLPCLGLWAALTFQLTDWRQVHAALARGVLPGFLALLLASASLYFWHFLNPIITWLRQPHGGTAPSPLGQRLARFSRDYWTVILASALIMPMLYLWPGRTGAIDQDLPRLAQLALLQLTVGVLIGLPAYLIALDRFGRLVAHLGLTEVHVSIKSKLMLVGGLLPLLSYCVLLYYYSLRTGSVGADALLVWGVLALLTFAATVICIRSLCQALQPVEEVLGRSGASTHSELAELRPRSTDEIGYLTQTLGRVFRRLTDQETHMHAVVDHAAEAILVVDERGAIDTFNAAAERLFGYRAQEIRGRPLSRLLPALCAEGEAPKVAWEEHEVQGLHRGGTPRPMSVRVSEMRISKRRMFTCLVADISARKAAEESLTRAEKRYRDLVETAHDLVWSISLEGRWTYLNGACKGIYGCEPQQLVGRALLERSAPDRAAPDAEAFAKLLRGDELVLYETVHMDRHGTARHLSFNARPMIDDTGRVVHISGTARDITEQKAVERRLAYQAEHDSLTGLFNRHYFQQELERLVARVGRGGTPCALFYIDLDQFKYINDTLGHAAGDRLLIEIARLLADHVRGSDLLARFGGDEFTVLLYDIAPQRVLQAAENFRNLFDAYRFHESGNAFNITCSIGAAVLDASTPSAEEVMSHADLACNMAKAQGRNRVNLYNPSDPDKAGMAEDMGWAARVRDMLDRDRFRLFYQPIVSVTDGRVQAYEVLVRMVCDDGQIILPGGFMPAAERFGLVHSVDRWTVRRAIQQLATARQNGSTASFSVNLSGRAFEDTGLLPMIQAMLDETGLDPALLTFEITETAAIANLGAAARFIGALKDIGCQFALDDFGSGFCSFTYLKHLPVDKLKIDGSFVQGLAHAPVDQAMVQSMNQVAHALGKLTIAEFVENAQTLELLRQYGVDYAQGNYLGKPLEAIHSVARPILVVNTRQ